MHFELAVLAALPLALAAPLIPAPPSMTAIPGQYIVKFKDNAEKMEIAGAVNILTNKPIHNYDLEGFKGMAVKMSDTVVKAMAALPNVEYIEQDAIMKANLGEIDTRSTYEKKAYTTQNPSTWGLGRISHLAAGATNYTYDTSGGADTCAYIIDTGVETTHPEFEGRATFLGNYAGDGINKDGNGHGTHCAGTIGSKTYGVAKKTKLFAVKVLDSAGSGSTSGVVAGVNAVIIDRKTRAGCSKGAVASLSLGGGKSPSLNLVVANAVTAGIFVTVAAGNNNADAGNYSPSSEPTVFTVGATDKYDVRAYFSNYGSVVDIFAPGVSILSTWISGSTNTISGTSMATPHVAGLAAYILGLEGYKAPSVLATRLLTLSIKNKISGLPAGTANKLAFNGNPTNK